MDPFTGTYHHQYFGVQPLIIELNFLVNPSTPHQSKKAEKKRQRKAQRKQARKERKERKARNQRRRDRRQAARANNIAIKTEPASTSQ